jgi:glycine/D-amino acid oxidase-like deaminating enzyme
MEEGNYREEHFDERELEATEHEVSYKDCEASFLVFCDGIKCLSNHLLRWLPVRPLKGETLLVEAKFFTDVLVNRGVYVVPDGPDRWRIGSTYQYQFESEDITPEAKIELTGNLESLLRIDYKVIAQHAGIRPVTPDRRPIIGKHPAHTTVLIFNGMGTKGVSLSPYFSEVLVRSMYGSDGINKEVDINRFKSLYWNSR